MRVFHEGGGQHHFWMTSEQKKMNRMMWDHSEMINGTSGVG